MSLRTAALGWLAMTPSRGLGPVLSHTVLSVPLPSSLPACFLAVFLPLFPLFFPVLPLSHPGHCVDLPAPCPDAAGVRRGEKVGERAKKYFHGYSMSGWPRDILPSPRIVFLSCQGPGSRRAGPQKESRSHCYGLQTLYHISPQNAPLDLVSMLAHKARAPGATHRQRAG